MQRYTSTQRIEAKKRLPEPTSSFLSSDTLSNLYLGIEQKHKLNLAQIMVVSEIVNDTLLGLEPESALETNLHQTLPRMSNADMRELVADLNDRIFKEAQRRLKENFIDTTGTNPKPQPPPEPEDAAPMPPPPPHLVPKLRALGFDVPEPSQEDIEKEKANDKETAVPIRKQSAPEPALKPEITTPAGPPISAERLAAATATKAEQKDVRPEQEGIQKVAVHPPQAPKIYKGVDPYREPVE
jgi:hypothetical protein